MGKETPIGTVPPFVGNWQEFQYYLMGPHQRLPEGEELRKSYEERLINESFEEFQELREDLLEVVELMKGHIRKADASEDNEQVDRSAWYLLFHALQIEGDFRGFRTRFKRGVVTKSKELADELVRIVNRMQAHVIKANKVGGKLYAERSVWFLAYAALKLNGLHCKMLDVNIRQSMERMSDEEFDDLMGEGK
jgi:hypothetical protein